jgi:hypothetical protein
VANSNTVISNPQLVAGNVPGVTAGTMTGFVAPSPLPIATPPQTPRSAASSVSGAVPGLTAHLPSAGVKRESEETKVAVSAEAKPDTPQEDSMDADAHVSKKRRVAPTLVSGLEK